MPLSRLDNFLKNVKGNILYVDPNSLDATDVIENQGNSMARPFKTIQRALIEASRFSYQKGLDNDRFEKTTIMLAPGDHYIDNRPGLIPDGAGNFITRAGTTTSDFSQFSTSSLFDIFDDNNALYKLNSVFGGVIVPRGVSIIGTDLRKTKVRPLYVPNPENDSIERTAIFRMTGATYTRDFSILDADINKGAYRNYSTKQYVPNYSHHKLTVFEYADGANGVDIADTFLTYKTSRTDLDMYYEKVGIAYGPASGREIDPDYPNSGVDIQPREDEFRIVGPTGGGIGISSIRSGDGASSTSVITVNLQSGLEGLNVDTRFIVDGVTDEGYNGSYVVDEVLTTDADNATTSFTYQVANPPSEALPAASGATVELSTNTVSSASPYIWNCTLRSVLGMCGVHADGDKVTGFKSWNVAQFTGVCLQTDNNAFVKYNSSSGTYEDSTDVDNLQNDPDAKAKPAYTNYHIKASNNAFIQLVSVSAIGFAEQFVTESGGDFSIANSNSHFGQLSFRADGFRDEAFSQDDVGYITHAIPPQEAEENIVTPTAIEFGSLDVAQTVGVANSTRLYIYNETNFDVPPQTVLQGFRLGAKSDEKLNLLISQSGALVNYTADVVMPNTNGETISIKTSKVGRSVGFGNSISSNILTFDENHTFQNGETIRVFSDNTRLPDGIDNNRIYFAITDNLNANQIKVAQTLSDAFNENELAINNFGGTLTVESRVSDKTPGDTGHPVQWDETNGQWYINTSSTNTIYPVLEDLGVSGLGEATSRTYIERVGDIRPSEERIYKYRYVIPAGSGISSARPPQNGFVLERSGDVTGATDTEVALQFNPNTVTMNNISEMRNFSFISGAKYSSGTIEFTSELPHRLSVGSSVVISNVTSTNFPVGTAGSGFNGEYSVTGITSAKTFVVSTSDSDPGTFNNDTSQRTTSLPTFRAEKFASDFYVYNAEQIREYVSGEQDGIYYLTLVDGSNTPPVAPFNTKRYSFSQPITNLYPQYDRDNPNSDPEASISYALPNTIGEVVIDDPKTSVTRETAEKLYSDRNVGTAITDFALIQAGTAGTVYASYDHGLNRITKMSVTSVGAGYGNGSGSSENLYNAILTGTGTGRNATARITVNATGQLTDIEVMDGGSAYEIGDVLTVVGTATTTGYTPGTVTVDNIYDNVNDVVRIAGVTSTAYGQYNQVHKITEVTNATEFKVAPSNDITEGVSLTGIGRTVTEGAYFYLTGPALGVISMDFNRATGIATVRTYQRHGYRVNNKIRIAGATDTHFNGDFLVTGIDNTFPLTRFTVQCGVATFQPVLGSAAEVFPLGLSAQGGTVGLNDQNKGRPVNAYAGITTSIAIDISTTTTDEIEIENVDQFDFKIGDYIRVNDEIMRIKTTVSTNPVRVFRGVFGTQPATHSQFDVVRKIECAPVEFRKPSSIRSSGHTFEYQGYGGGNYSTSLPEKQVKQLSLNEQLRSQALQSNGGKTTFTGMTDTGDFYIGRKRTSAVTGAEEVFNTPIQTATGEDVSSIGIFEGSAYNVSDYSNLTVTNAIKVEGGKNATIASEFDGPVIFTGKVTSVSPEGVEANSLFLQGDATVSRNFTVGISTPTSAGTAGDVVYNANPTEGGTVGWVRTLSNNWREFGHISVNEYEDTSLFDSVGIGTTSVENSTLKVVAGSTEFNVDSDGVGIGTTANGAKLRVNGNIYGTFIGDGSGLSNIPTDSAWVIDTGVLSPKLNRSVGIGTTIPSGDYTLEVGTVGTGATDLYVRNGSRFLGDVHLDGTVEVSGLLKSTNFDLDSVTGSITAGIITTTTLKVSGTNLVANATGVGVGTATPRADLDVEGSTRLKAYHEVPVNVSSVSGVVTLDLQDGQSFLVTTTENIVQFRIANPTANAATSFTVRVLQGTTGRTVDIDTFRTPGGATIPVYWPGGVAPVVTSTANAVDIYSFMTFDGGSTLYGVIGGQNFS